MTNDYARGYKNGYRDGKKQGEQIVRKGIKLDFTIIYSAFLAALSKEGWGEDELIGLIDKVNGWLQEHSTMCAEDVLKAASDEIGFDIQMTEEM